MLNLSPPGPRGRPIIGFIPEMRNGPLNFLTKMAQDYPGIAKFKVGNESLYLISKTEYVRHILLDNFQNYEKLWGYDKLYPIFGRGLLTSNGSFWQRQRKLTQPAFHRERLNGFAKAMADRTQLMLDRWEKYAAEGTPFELGDEVRSVTMDIVTGTMFGLDSSRANHVVAKAIEVILAETYDQIFTVLGPLRKHLPTRKNREFKHACKTMTDLIYSIIDERRRKPGDTGDLLSMYMQMRDEETGEGMTDEELKDEVMTIFFAGHETTAHTVAWVCMMLSRHPEVATRAREEARRILGGRSPSLADVSELDYLERVIQETMRVLPVSWIMTRTAKRPDRIGDYEIPAGATLLVSEYVMHRLPRYWDNPEGFDPERFTPENSKGREKYAYLPFGQGPRFCIGSGFAMMETQIMLAMMLRKFRIDLVPGHPIEPEPVMTLRPKHGVKVTISKA